MTLTLDRAGKIGPIEKLGWSYTGGPDGARSLLSAIAGSMIAVAATAFSITIVALSLLLRILVRDCCVTMQDTGNQVVHIHCHVYLLLARTADSPWRGYNVLCRYRSQSASCCDRQHQRVDCSIHASTIIQASHVISEASADLDNAIERLFPEQIGRSVSEYKRQVEEMPAGFDSEAYPIRTTGGYLQAIDDEELMKIAKSTSSVAPQVSTRKVCCQKRSGYGLAGERVNQTHRSDQRCLYSGQGTY